MAGEPSDRTKAFNDGADKPPPELKKDFRRAHLKGVAREDFNEAAGPPDPPPPPSGSIPAFHPPGVGGPPPKGPKSTALPVPSSSKLPGATPLSRKQEFGREASRGVVSDQDQLPTKKAGPPSPEEIRTESKIRTAKSSKKEKLGHDKEVRKQQVLQKLRDDSDKKKEREAERNDLFDR